MATDPFANIGFRENFSQAYYTEVIIARNKKSIRFASSTPTVTNSYRHLMSGNVYRVAELLSITGPKQPIAIENKVQYKRDQPYSLYYQNQIGDEFRIQNVDPNLTAEGREAYWARVSAPLGPEWAQYYAGDNAKIGYIMNLIDRNLEDFTGTNYNDVTTGYNGFISGKPNNDPTKPNLYDEISVSRIGSTGLRQGQTATIAVEPGIYKSFLSCKVTEGTKYFDSFGQEIIPKITNEFGDFFASEFALNFYIFPGYHIFYYGTWKIAIEPTNQTGAHKVRITQGRYPAADANFIQVPNRPPVTGTYGDDRLVRTIDCTFQWDGSLSKFNLITMKYVYTPSPGYNGSTGSLKINNSNTFDLYVNGTSVYSQRNGGMWPPSVYNYGYGDTIQKSSVTQSAPIDMKIINGTPPKDKAFLIWETPVGFEIGKSEVAFVLITDKMLDLYGLYTHLIRYERPMANLEIETNPDNGGVAPPSGGGGIVSKYYNRATFSIAPETLIQLKKIVLDFMLKQPNYQSSTLITDPILAKMLADPTTVTTFGFDIEEQSKNKNIIDLLAEPVALTVDGSPAYDLVYGINSKGKLRARIVETTSAPQHVVSSETELYGLATYTIKTSLTNDWHTGTVTMTAKFRILVDDSGIYDPKIDPYVNKNPNKFTLNKYGSVSVDSMTTDWSFIQGADGGDDEIIISPPGAAYFKGSWSWAPLLGQIVDVVYPYLDPADNLGLYTSYTGFNEYNEKLYTQKPGSTGKKKSDWELAQFPIHTDSILYDVGYLDRYPNFDGELFQLRRPLGPIRYTTRGNPFISYNYEVDVQYTIRDVTILSSFTQDSPVNVTMDVTLSGKQPTTLPGQPSGFTGRTKPFNGVKLTFIFPVKVVLYLPPQALSAPEEIFTPPEVLFTPQAIPSDFYTKYESHRAVPITGNKEVAQLFSDLLPDGLPVNFNMSNKAGTGDGGDPLPPGPGTPTKYYNRAQWTIDPADVTDIDAFLKDFMTSKKVLISRADQIFNIIQDMLTDNRVTKTFTNSIGYGQHFFNIVGDPSIIEEFGDQWVLMNYSSAYNPSDLTPPSISIEEDRPPSTDSALRLIAKIPLTDSNRATSTISLISRAQYTFEIPANYSNPSGDLSSHGAGTIEITLDYDINDTDAATLPNGGNFNPYIVGNTNQFQISSQFTIHALNATVNSSFESGDIVGEYTLNTAPIINEGNNPITPGSGSLNGGTPILINMSNIPGTDGAIVPGGTPPPDSGVPLAPGKNYTAFFSLVDQPFKAFEEDSLRGLFYKYHNRDNINYKLYDQILSDYTQVVPASRLASDVFKQALIERSKIPGNPIEYEGYLLGTTAYFNDAECVLLNNGLNGTNLFSPPGHSCEVITLNYRIDPDIQIIGGTRAPKNTKLVLGSNIIKMGVTVTLTCQGGSDCVVVGGPSGPIQRPKVGGVPTESISYEFSMEIIVTENTSGVTPPTAPTIRVSYSVVVGGLFGALVNKYGLGVSGRSPITMVSGGVYSKDILYNEATMKIDTRYIVKAVGTDSLLYENGNISPVKMFARGERMWGHDSVDPTNDYTLIDFYITAYIDTRYTKVLNGSLVSELDESNTTRAAIYYVVEPVTVPFPRADGTIVPSKKLPTYFYSGDYTNVLMTKIGFTPIGGGGNNDTVKKYVGTWNLESLIKPVGNVLLNGGNYVNDLLDIYKATLNRSQSTIYYVKVLYEIVAYGSTGTWQFVGSPGSTIKSKSIQYWMESQSKYRNVQGQSKPYGVPISLVYTGTSDKGEVTLTITMDIAVRDVTLEKNATTSVTLDTVNTVVRIRDNKGPDIVEYSSYGATCTLAVDVYESMVALSAPEEETLMLPQAVPSDFEWSPPKYITIKSDSLKFYDGKNDVPYFRNGYIDEAAQTYSFIGTRTSQNDLIATYRHGDFSSYDSATTNYDVVVGGFELVYHRGTQDTLTFLPVEIIEPNTKKKFVCFGSVREVGNIINSSTKSTAVMTFITDYGSTSDKNGDYWVYDESWKQWSFKIPINTGDELNLNCYTCPSDTIGTLATKINLITKFNTKPTPNNPPPAVDPNETRDAEFSYAQIAKKPYTIPIVYPPGFPSPSTYHFAFPKRLTARPNSTYNTSSFEYEFFLASVDITQRYATYKAYSWKNNELIIGGFTVAYTPHESFRLSKLDVYSADLDRDFECFGLSRFVYDRSGNLLSGNKWQFVPTYKDPNNFANWFLTVVQDAPTGGNYFNTYCNEGGGKAPDYKKRSCEDNFFNFQMRFDASFSYYTPPKPIAIVAPVPTGPPVQLPIYSTGYNVTSGLPLTFASEPDSNWEITKFISGPEKTPIHYWKFNGDLSDSTGNLPFVPYPVRTLEIGIYRNRDMTSADIEYKEGVVWSNDQTTTTAGKGLYPISAGIPQRENWYSPITSYYGKGREYGTCAYVASQTSNRLIDSDAWTITCWYKIPVEPIANFNPLQAGMFLGFTPYTLREVFVPDIVSPPSSYTFGPQLITDSAYRLTVTLGYLWNDVPTFPDYTIPLKSGHIRAYFTHGRTDYTNSKGSATFGGGGTPVNIVDENGNGIFRSYKTGEIVPETDQFARPVNFIDIAPVVGSTGPDGLSKNIWSFLSIKKAAGVNDRLVFNIGGNDYTARFPSYVVSDQLLNKFNYMEPKVPIDDLRIYDEELSDLELKLISRINSTGGSIVPREYIPGGTITGVETNSVYAYDHFKTSEAIQPYWWPAGYTSGSTIVPDRKNLYQQYNARWVSPPPKLSLDALPATKTYNYTTKVDLAGISLSTVKISFLCSGDDRIIDIIVNGTSTGLNNISEVGGLPANNSTAYSNLRYRNLWDVKLPSGDNHLYVQTINTIDIVVENIGITDPAITSNPTGLYVYVYEKTGIQLPILPNPNAITIDIADTGYDKIVGQQIPIGSADSNWVIEKVVRPEIVPTHYWRFNNSLDDLTGALSFLQNGPAQHTFKTGVVVGKSGNPQNIGAVLNGVFPDIPGLPAAEFGKHIYVESLPSEILKVAKSQSWTMTGWIKIPQQLSGQLDFAELFTISAFSKSETYGPSAKKGMILTFKYSYASNTKYPPPYSPGSPAPGFPLYANRMYAQFDRGITIGGSQRDPLYFSDLTSGELLYRDWEGTVKSYAEWQSLGVNNFTNYYPVNTIEIKQNGFGPSNWAFIAIKIIDTKIVADRGKQVSINVNGVEQKFYFYSNDNDTAINYIDFSCPVDDLRIYDGVVLPESEIQFISKLHNTKIITGENDHITAAGVAREYGDSFLTWPSPAYAYDYANTYNPAQPYWWPQAVPNQASLYGEYKARWISPPSLTGINRHKLDSTGLYYYKTTFNLANIDPETVKISLLCTGDDQIKDIIVNGKSTGFQNITQVGGIPGSSSAYENSRFRNLWDVKLPSGKNNLYTQLSNTLTIVIENKNLEDTIAISNPSGLYVHFYEKTGIKIPEAEIIDPLIFNIKQEQYVPTSPPVIPPIDPIVLPKPVLTPIDGPTRSSKCLELSAFTYFALGPVNTNKIAGTKTIQAFNRKSTIWAFAETSSPDTFGQNRSRYGFSTSSAKWVKDPGGDSCKLQRGCVDTPSATMAKNNVIYRMITAPADSWITITWRQETPLPGYRLKSDNNGIKIATVIKSANGKDHIRVTTDKQSIFGMPTKRIIPPCYSAVEEYNYGTEVQIQILIYSMGATYENFVDDIVIEYGPGYCNEIVCIDTFTGTDSVLKYVGMSRETITKDSTEAKLIQYGPPELNFGSKYYIEAGSTASQTIELGGYLNKGAKLSVSISGYSETLTNGIILIVETYDENFEPLEQFTENLGRTFPGNFYTTDTFDNASEVNHLTISTFILGQAARIIKVFVTSQLGKFSLGFIDVCSDQDVTFLKRPPALECKDNVNKLRVIMNVNGIPREEVNIFQAFCRYSVLTNTHYRTQKIIETTPSADGRTGTALPFKCDDAALCNYWKQQGVNNAIQQKILTRTVTDNKIAVDISKIKSGSYNNLTGLDNWIWASPLNKGFGPDQYILQFPQTPNKIAEDNFVESLEIFLSVNIAQVGNADCLSAIGSAYKFADHITVSSDSIILPTSIPKLNVENPTTLRFDRVSITVANKITTANYVLARRTCSDKNVIMGGFTIEHHPENGSYFSIKPYDWSKSPNLLLGVVDNCRSILDYSTLYTFGAITTANNLAVNDRTRTTFFFKPNGSYPSKGPVSPQFFELTIQQSSQYDMFSASSSTNSVPVRLVIDQTPLKTTVGPEVSAFFTWDSAAELSVTDYTGGSECKDPADTISVTIEYTNAVGTMKRFTKEISLEDANVIDTVNSEDWNALGAFGNGLKGDYATWVSAKFDLDLPYGGGLDQCLAPIVDPPPPPPPPPPVYPTVTGEATNLFSILTFENSIKGMYIPYCTPEVIVAETIQGASQNEIQSMIIPVSTGGFYTLTFDFNGSYSVEVPYNADAAGLRASLAGLPNIGSSNNVTVSGSGSANAPFIIEFTGDLAITELPLLIGDTTSLSSVASGTVIVVTTGSTSERQRIINTASTRSPLVLSFDSYITGNIQFNASLNEFQTALSLVPSLGAEISVTGNVVDRDSAFTGPYDVDFIGNLAGQSQPTLTPLVAGYTQELMWSGVNGVNTKQLIRISATSGTFTITIFDTVNNVQLSATTAPISYNASETDVANAIAAAASFITVADMVVTKLPATDDATLYEWTIEFVENFANVPVQKLVLNTGLLVKQGQIIIARTQTGLGVGEKQRMSLKYVTGGYYYLQITVGVTTLTTAAIPYDATDIRVEQEISALDFFSTGDVSVRRDPLLPEEYKAYIISFRSSFGNMPMIVPVFQDLLICDPYLQMPGGPYDYKVPICAVDPLSLSGVQDFCYPGPNDGVSPLPDCCDLSKTGDNTIDVIQYQRELFNPDTRLYGKVVTVRQLAAMKRIIEKDFSVYSRDFSTNTLTPVSYDTMIRSGLSLLFVEKTVDTSAGLGQIVGHLSSSQELLPTRVLWNLK